MKLKEFCTLPGCWNEFCTKLYSPSRSESQRGETRTCSTQQSLFSVLHRYYYDTVQRAENTNKFRSEILRFCKSCVLWWLRSSDDHVTQTLKTLTKPSVWCLNNPSQIYCDLLNSVYMRVTEHYYLPDDANNIG